MVLEVDLFQTLTLTQGAADAFVEASFDTGIVPENAIALEVSLVEFEFTATTFSGLAADASLSFAMSRDTKVAVPAYNDADCIFSEGFAFSLNTSGAIITPTSFRWVPPSGTLIVEPTIYVQFDSAATGGANTMYCRVHYKEVKVNEVDILRLLNNR